MFHCYRPVTLPAQDGSTANEQNTFFSCPSAQDPYFGPVLPISAVAGLVGDEAETFKVSSVVCITACGGGHLQCTSTDTGQEHIEAEQIK